MSNPKKDIEFLKKQLKKRQEWYRLSSELAPWDLTPVSDDTPITSPEEERIARLADDYGFDGSLFRNLIHDPEPLSIQSIRKLAKRIETIPRIIAKIEKAIKVKQTETKTPTDLIDLSKALKHFYISRSQLKRDITAKKIKSYRKNPKGKHYVSTSELEKNYLPK
jgi:hypothetical protein